jgi:type IV pilus assembly protein PilB
LCTQCRRAVRVSGDAVRAHGFDLDAGAVEVYEAVGCPRCGGSGYKGRVGLYEVMAVTEEIRELVVQRANVDRIADAAVRAGMRRLREDGLAKVLDGRTSFAEVARVTG